MKNHDPNKLGLAEWLCIAAFVLGPGILGWLGDLVMRAIGEPARIHAYDDADADDPPALR